MEPLKSASDLEKLRKDILAKKDPKRLAIAVCVSTGCQALGVQKVLEAFNEEISNTYAFPENPMQISSLSGSVQDNNLLEIEVDFSGNIMKFDIGFDNNYRFSPSLFSPGEKGLIQGENSDGDIVTSD